MYRYVFAIYTYISLYIGNVTYIDIYRYINTYRHVLAIYIYIVIYIYIIFVLHVFHAFQFVLQVFPICFAILFLFWSQPHFGVIFSIFLEGNLVFSTKIFPGPKTVGAPLVHADARKGLRPSNCALVLAQPVLRRARCVWFIVVMY